MIKRSKQALEFVRENDKATVVKHVLSHDAHPMIQFVKYGMCGVLAVVIHWLVVYTLGLTVLPAIGRSLPVELKQHNGMINNIIAFFVSGIVVYWLNRKYVFKPGRHHAAVEAFLFFAVAGLALLAAVLIYPLIFKYVKTNEYVEHFANFGFVFTSAMVNFVARKFIIFKG